MKDDSSFTFKYMFTAPPCAPCHSGRWRWKDYQIHSEEWRIPTIGLLMLSLLLLSVSRLLICLSLSPGDSCMCHCVRLFIHDFTFLSTCRTFVRITRRAATDNVMCVVSKEQTFGGVCVSRWWRVIYSLTSTLDTLVTNENVSLSFFFYFQCDCFSSRWSFPLLHHSQHNGSDDSES